MDIKDPDNPNDLAQMDGYVYDDTESAYVRLYIYTDAEGNVMAKSFYVTKMCLPLWTKYAAV